MEPEHKMSHRTGPTHEHRGLLWAALGWGAAVRSQDPCGSPRHALTGAGRPVSLARGGPARQCVLDLPPFPLPHFLRPSSPQATPAGPPPPPAAAVPDSGSPSSAQGQVGISFAQPLPWGCGPPPGPHQDQAQHCVRGSREVQYGSSEELPGADGRSLGRSKETEH